MQILAIVLEVAVRRSDINPSSINSVKGSPKVQNKAMINMTYKKKGNRSLFKKNS